MLTYASFLLVVTNPQPFFEQITAITTTITAAEIMKIAATTTPPTIATVLVDSEVAVVGGVMSVPKQRKFGRDIESS